MLSQFRKLIVITATCVFCVLVGLAVWYRSAAATLEYSSRNSKSNIIIAQLKSVPAADTLCAKPSVSANAAEKYLRAIKSYSERRAPFLKNRRLNPFANEPTINPEELNLMILAAMDSNCDFATVMNSGVALNNKPITWDVPIGNKLLLDRTYISPARQLVQAALNEGKRVERLKLLPPAEQAYLASLTLGERITRLSRSLMDVQFGIELQRRSLHYLDVLYGKMGDNARREKVWRIGDGLKKLESEIRVKFRSLDDLSTALYLFRNDLDPVWRAEAALALRSGIIYHHIGWPLSSIIQTELANGSEVNQEMGKQALAVPVSTLRKNGSEQNTLSKNHGAGS